MKALFLHSDYIKFKATKKALKNVKELDEGEKKLSEIKEALVVLTSVEKSDSNIKEIVGEFVKNVRDVAKQVGLGKNGNVVLYPYAHLSPNLANPETAMSVLNETESELKKTFKVSKAPFGYYKEFEIKVKGHPLAELSREINILGTSEKIPRQPKEHKIILDRSKLKPNDHRILGEEMEIFLLSDEIGPGLPLWLPNGEIIKNELTKFAREIEEKDGYKYVSTPHITKGGIYEKTGHLPYYADTMFSPMDIDGVKYYLKPMNCPHHHIIFNKIAKSYRDLPLKLAEPGTVYRNELSGVTYGLMRVRYMTQNDAHIYCTPEQLKDEFLKILRMVEMEYKTIGLKDYWFRLSLPDFKKNPKKYTGDEKEWKFATTEIKKAMREWGKDFVEEKDEAAFYGPKIDIQIKNSQGKEESISTIQVDIVVPKRMGLTYVDSKGQKKTPIVIHRAPLGSSERFIAFLLEQTNGRLPLWLAPTQIRVLSFTERNVGHAKKVIEQIAKEIPNIRLDADFRDTTMQSKVKDAEIMRIPYTIVVGDKEEKSGEVAIREKGNSKIKSLKTADFIKNLKKEIGERL